MNAVAARMDHSSTQSDYGTEEFVTVHVGDQIFGVEVKAIQDVFALQSLTPVPGARKDVAGVLNIRGRILTAIDARVRLGLPPRAEGYHGMMAVGVEHEGEAFGILVDKVGEVLRLHERDFELNPMNMDPNWKMVSKGIFRLDGQLLMSLDIGRLLAA